MSDPGITLPPADDRARPPAVDVVAVRKGYGRRRVLDGLSLRVAAGEVYGLLGPNGAGKSTLVHLLLGFLRPSAGEIRVLGQAPARAVHRVGYLPERARHPAHVTAREYLSLLGRLSGVAAVDARADQILGLVGLAAAADRRLGGFSKGMLQRFGVGQALLHDPELLVVDEPTSGLDPGGQRELLDLLAGLRARGHTVLLCTHQLAEAEALCDRVGILRGGRIAAEVDLDALGSSGGVAITTRPAALPAAVERTLLGLGGVRLAGGALRVDDEATAQQVLAVLLGAGVVVAEARRLGGALESLYLRTTDEPVGSAR